MMDLRFVVGLPNVVAVVEATVAADGVADVANEVLDL